MNTMLRNTILAFLSMTLFMSCAKELDETTTSTVLEEPTIHDGYLIGSTVLDENDDYLVGAEVSFLSSEYEFSTETDTKGAFEFEIPSDIEGGYLTIYKAPYHYLNLYFSKNHALSPNIKIRNQFKEVNPPIIDLDDMWVIEGRVTYPDGTIPENLNYKASSWSSDNEDFRILFLGDYTAGIDGRFLITGDSLSARPSIEIGGSAADERCLSGFGITHKVEQAYTDLGVLIYERDYEEMFNISIQASECEDDLVAKVYFAAQQPLGLFDEELGPLSVPYCSEFGIKHAYVGVEDASGDNFDGNFYGSLFTNAIEEGNNYSLEPCTPSGYFFDMTIDGTTLSYDVKYDSENELFVFDNSDLSISFEYDPTFSNCNTSSCGLKEFDFTWMTQFDFVDLSDPANNLDLGEVFMDQVVDNEVFVAGIIMNTGFPLDLKIRFRIEKI